jgi:hypothetical protein
MAGSPFESLLNAEEQRQLATAQDKATAEHGGAATVDYCIANLMFGFWTTMTTQRYRNQFWGRGIHWNFADAPAGTTLADLQRRLQAICDWRNRMAHHYALFDKGPAAEYGNILTVISWISPELRSLTVHVSRVGAVIAARPAAKAAVVNVMENVDCKSLNGGQNALSYNKDYGKPVPNLTLSS